MLIQRRGLSQWANIKPMVKNVHSEYLTKKAYKKQSVLYDNRTGQIYISIMETHARHVHRTFHIDFYLISEREMSLGVFFAQLACSLLIPPDEQTNGHDYGETL